jgi:hypothetical protein
MDAERYSAQLEGESNLAPSATVSSVSLQEFYPYSLPFACTASHARPEGSAARGECVGVRPTSRTTQATARAPTGGKWVKWCFCSIHTGAGTPPTHAVCSCPGAPPTTARVVTCSAVSAPLAPRADIYRAEVTFSPLLRPSQVRGSYSAQLGSCIALREKAARKLTRKALPSYGARSRRSSAVHRAKSTV